MIELGLRELIVLGGTTMLLLGKEELPGVCRVLGKGLGSMVGFMQGARGHFSRLASSDDALVGLRREIEQNMQELQSIRAELHTAGAIRYPLASSRNLPRSHEGRVSHPSPERKAKTNYFPSKNLPASSGPHQTGSAMISTRLAQLAVADMQLEGELKLDGAGKSPNSSEASSNGSGIVSSVITDMLIMDQWERANRGRS